MVRNSIFRFFERRLRVRVKMSDVNASNILSDETSSEARDGNYEGEREFVHPLQKNDPVLVNHVDFVTLEFLERANHPIPKNQLLNKQAFGELSNAGWMVLSNASGS